MLGAMRTKLAKVWTDLAHVGERQPLNRAVLVVLVFLDLFVLVSIFDGLDAHTRQLTSPDERVPETCVEIVIDRSWNETNRLDRLAAAVQRLVPPYGERAEPRRPLHLLCAPLVGAVDAVLEDDTLVRTLRARGRAQGELRDLDAALSALRPAYDTALLQGVAKQPDPPAIPTVEKELREKTGALEAARAQLATLDSALDGSPRVAALWQRVASVREEDRATLEADLRRMTFWFPLKRLGMQLLFLLPLFAVFYAWSARSARRGRGVQSLVASHLLVVAFVPIFLKLVEALYDVIPKRLIAKLLALLASLNLVALWHYLVIAVAVAGTLLLVVVGQRKLFSREKLLERRIARGLCQDCGKRLPAGARACPFCGFAQFERCPGCGGSAHACASHCAECGVALRGAPGAGLEPR